MFCLLVLFTIFCFYLYTAIHCVWDDWIVGECSKTCGTGTRKNTRTKLVVETNGGTCSGQPTETEECILQECPGMS